VPRGQRDKSLRLYSRLSRPELLLFLPSSSSVVLTRLSGPRSRPSTFFCSAGNRTRDLRICCQEELQIISGRKFCFKWRHIYMHFTETTGRACARHSRMRMTLMGLYRRRCVSAEIKNKTLRLLNTFSPSTSLAELYPTRGL
jgi:hypothetical protein